MKLSALLIILFLVLSLGVFTNSILFIIIGVLSLIGLIISLVKIINNNPKITLKELFFIND